MSKYIENNRMKIWEKKWPCKLQTTISEATRNKIRPEMAQWKYGREKNMMR
jgi:hypothetical protein